MFSFTSISESPGGTSRGVTGPVTPPPLSSTGTGPPPRHETPPRRVPPERTRHDFTMMPRRVPVESRVQTLRNTHRPGKVKKLAAALVAGYRRSPPLRTSDRILLDGEALKAVRAAMKDLAGTEYLRGPRFEEELAQLHDEIAEAFLALLPDDGQRPEKALVKKWLANNLFDLRFQVKKDLGPQFERDLTTPQERVDVETAYGTTGAMLVQESCKTRREHSTFLQMDPSLGDRLRNFFRAMLAFVAGPKSDPGDDRVRGELKGLMDKGFNPKFGGMGRFPKPTDPDFDERFLGWAFRKYDLKNPALNRHVHALQQRMLQYFNEHIDEYARTEDPHVLDHLAIQFHGTIGQIINDVLLNNALNLDDRTVLYNDLIEAGILAGKELPPEKRSERLAELTALHRTIRRSPLLMEIQLPGVARDVSELGLQPLKEALGPRYSVALDGLSDALLRDRFGGLDKLAGRRGRFRDINEAYSQALSRRDKPGEKNLMNLPDGRLDGLALESVPRLSGEDGPRREEMERFVEKVGAGDLFGHFARPVTAQRQDVLPTRLRELGGPLQDGETNPARNFRVLGEALREELRHGLEEMAELGALQTELQETLRQVRERDGGSGSLKFEINHLEETLRELAGDLRELRQRQETLTELSDAFAEALIQENGGTPSSAQLELESLRNQRALAFTRGVPFDPAHDARIAVLEQRLAWAGRLRTELAGTEFGSVTVRDEQGRTHRLSDLAVEKSVTNMLHESHQRTLCSISGTTTDIGVALVAQYGPEKIRALTRPLLELARALREGREPPPLPPEFKAVFSSVSLFMQGGQYHTPAEVLGGLLIVGAALDDPDRSGDPEAMRKDYQALLLHLTKSPEDFFITDPESRRDFRAALPREQRRLLSRHTGLIRRDTEKHHLRYWPSVPPPQPSPGERERYYSRLGISKPPEPRRRGFFDDMSLRTPPLPPLSERRTRDDFDLRPSGLRRLGELEDLGPPPPKPEPLPRRDQRRQVALEELDRSSGAPVPLQARTRLPYEEDVLLRPEPDHSRTDVSELQSRRLEQLTDFSTTERVPRVTSLHEERVRARRTARESELETVVSEHGKDWMSPRKDAMGVLKNAVSLPQEFLKAYNHIEQVTQASPEFDLLDKTSSVLGLVTYPMGMVKGVHKHRLLRAQLRKAEGLRSQFDILQSEVDKANKHLAQQRRELEKIQQKMERHPANSPEHQRRFTELQGQLEEQQRRRAQTQAQLDELLGRSGVRGEAWQVQVEQLRGELEGFDREIRQLKKELAPLSRANAEYNRVVESLQTPLKQALEAYELSRLSVQTMRALLSAKTPLADRLDEEIRDLRYKVKENAAKVGIRYPFGFASSVMGVLSWIGSGIKAVAGAAGSFAWQAVGKVFGLFGLISGIASGVRIWLGVRSINQKQKQLEQVERSLAEANRRLETKLRQDLGRAPQPEEIAAARRKSNMHHLLEAEKYALRREISELKKDNAVEGLSMASSFASFLVALAWITSVAVGAAAIVSGVGLVLGVVGCAIGVGVVIARQRRASAKQNQLANLQEGYTDLKQGVPLDQVAQKNKGVARILRSPKELRAYGVGEPRQMTKEAVLQCLEAKLNRRYVNVTAQNVVRDLLTELELAKKLLPDHPQFGDGYLPGPSKDPDESGNLHEKYFLELERAHVLSQQGREPPVSFNDAFPTLAALRAKGLRPREIAQVAYAGGIGDNVRALLKKFNLKPIATTGERSDAFHRAPRSEEGREVGLRGGSSGLPGNKFQSGLNSVLVALKANGRTFERRLEEREGDPPAKAGLARRFEHYRREPMLTGAEGRELREQLEQFAFGERSGTAPEARHPREVFRQVFGQLDLSERHRELDIAGARTLGQRLSGATLSLAPLAQRQLDQVPERRHDGQCFVLSLQRFDDAGRPTAIPVNPLGSIREPESGRKLRPNVLICHRGDDSEHGAYVAYVREGDKWYLEKNGHREPVDLDPDVIAAKRGNRHNYLEKVFYDQVYEDIFLRCTEVVYEENPALPERLTFESTPRDMPRGPEPPPSGGWFRQPTSGSPPLGEPGSGEPPRAPSSTGTIQGSHLELDGDPDTGEDPRPPGPRPEPQPEPRETGKTSPPLPRPPLPLSPGSTGPTGSSGSTSTHHHDVPPPGTRDSPPEPAPRRMGAPRPETVPPEKSLSRGDLDLLLRHYPGDGQVFESARLTPGGPTALALLAEMLRAGASPENEVAQDIIRPLRRAFATRPGGGFVSPGERARQLGLTVVPTLGDGNCYFNALGAQLGQSSRDVRRQVVLDLERVRGEYGRCRDGLEREEYLRTHPDLAIPSLLQIENTRKDARRAGVVAWGEDFHCAFVARAFQRPVVRIGLDGVMLHVPGQPARELTRPEDLALLEHPLFLVHNGGNHWEFARPR